ncbi:sugar phosphate isomerase/epimerase family protein [Oceaniglobus trochenteri]|uniref:sugar phosphate isomerase/epimerase family protein n=1 Tax=Oceaniglobus trochenteri TaxID=2763260 RepID=UPI001CFFE8DA|nr:sugar phosphate isomerase/epimerase [Oceaniglobus trochenteri]
MTGFSYQLYSSRDFGPLSDTLTMLGDLGYDSVEGYGALFDDLDDPAPLRDRLDAAGLAMRSTHMGLERLASDPSGVIAMARALGVSQVFAPYIQPADRPADAEGWAALAARLVQMGAPLRDAGLTFGWHNHDFEFHPLPDGTLPMDILLDKAPDLTLELDVAWAVVAGQDPRALIARHGPRLAAAHVKDRAPEGENTDEDGWTDVGHGTLDWPALLGDLRAAGCTNLVMEHDRPADDARFARRSLAFVQGGRGHE